MKNIALTIVTVLILASSIVFFIFSLNTSNNESPETDVSFRQYNLLIPPNSNSLGSTGILNQEINGVVKFINFQPNETYLEIAGDDQTTTGYTITNDTLENSQFYIRTCQIDQPCPNISRIEVGNQYTNQYAEIILSNITSLLEEDEININSTTKVSTNGDIKEVLNIFATRYE